MRRTLITAALLALAPAAACSSGSDDPDWQADDPAYFACEDTARYASDGYPVASRQERMDEMNSWAARSSNAQIVEQGAAVSRVASGPDEAFRLALDVLAATCLDLGWEEAQS